MNHKSKGFTLVELLIVIAILGILASAIMVAMNPGKRMAQARDSQRKSDVNAIANALIGYYVIKGEYPTERRCDTSRGTTGGNEGGVNVEWCSQASGTDWASYNQSIVEQLMDEGFLKKLPKDPINNSTFYYRYEPYAATGNPNSIRYCSFVPCHRYWIGARLESVDDPSKENKIVFRCSDNELLPYTTGCKEVELLNAGGFSSFDSSLYIQ